VRDARHPWALWLLTCYAFTRRRHETISTDNTKVLHKSTVDKMQVIVSRNKTIPVNYSEMLYFIEIIGPTSYAHITHKHGNAATHLYKKNGVV